MGRVYFFIIWFKEEGFILEDVVVYLRGKYVENLRRRLLSEVFKLYDEVRLKMNGIFKEVRGLMIGVVEMYMEIGRVLRELEGGVELERGKVIVFGGRRLKMVFKVLFFV